MRSSSSRVAALLLAAVVSSMAQQDADEQSSSTSSFNSSSFNASTSSTSSTSPLSYQSCVASWVGADTSQDGFLSRAEYINWIRTANPYVNCPNISSINAFLGDLPFATTFTDLACLCTHYSHNQTCCDIPRIALPATYTATNTTTTNNNNTYSIAVCQIVRNVLALECNTPDTSTASSTPPTPGPTGYIVITQPPRPFNVSSSGYRPTPSPVPTATDGQPVDPIEWPKQDPSDASAANGPDSSSSGTNQILQVALPLLLVALAALLLGLTIILYQKRRHRLCLPDTPDKQGNLLPNASTGNVSHSEGSTESDEEHAVIVDPERERDDAEDPVPSSQSSSGRPAMLPPPPATNRAGVPKARSNTVRLTSLLHSLGLEPLREETCSEDEDGTQTSVAEVQSSSLNGRHSPTTNTTHDRYYNPNDDEWGLDDTGGDDVPNGRGAVAPASSSERTEPPQSGGAVEIIVVGDTACEILSDGLDDFTTRGAGSGTGGGADFPCSGQHHDESFDEEGSV